MPTPFPERPWQMIGTDLFELDNLNYLIVVDYFSLYIEVVAMQKTTKSHEVIRALKAIFARHGIPEELRSDNGSLILQKNGVSGIQRVAPVSHSLTVKWSAL